MKTTTLVLLLSVTLACLSLTSCASMFGKSNYPLTINTNPAGADIKITDQKGVDVYTGQTPTTITLKSSGGYLRSATYNIHLSNTGYKDQNITISSSINGWYWANIFLGGVLGMLIIDPLTGAMYKLDNAPLNITLAKKEEENKIAKNELNIIDIKDVPEDLKAYLVKIN